MTTEEPDDDLAWLRKENALLRVERDMLMRVAAGYARDVARLRGQERPGPCAGDPPH
ncbi:hypothetical protein [Amycolatopsis australiensis]|uniref:Transposase n=1 Tax=Amycolatopsis australiensis TaxID=546364 RepID=A0A1K1SMR5_9PSEU|nr:hypothetical protein [Amycolatopsis australiensis]SFW85586.1 hypothetical protein SAMN04489730_6177 [Amycolatopsis australiensis]